MITNYKEANQYLKSLIPTQKQRKYPGALGLERSRELLELLGNPQKKYDSIHVTGTSGKGSTSYLIASILQEAGYKVGLHTSPHLEKVTERIQINGQNINDNKFIHLVNKITPIVDTLAESKIGQPTFFEVIAALAFMTFAEENVDIAVVEVGMGGKYDATNVLNPEVSVITNIGLDHTNVLGSTVEQIAADKMQIIKIKSKAVIGAKQRSVLRLIKRHCQKVAAQMIQIASKNVKIKSVTDQGTIFNLNISDKKFYNLWVSLLGEYQADNAALAIAAVTCLNHRKYQIKENDIRSALRKANFPGRFEVINKKPLFVLDGAHNKDKVEALVSSFKKIFKQDNFEEKLIVVFACKKGKDYINMLKILSKIANTIILTKFEKETDIGFDLSLEPEIIKKNLNHKLGKVELITIDKPIKAIKKALKLSNEQKDILITGSLYLIGNVRGFAMQVASS